MRYMVEQELEEFEPWGNAVSIWNAIIENEEAYDYMNDFFNEYTGDLSETDINDIIWFDAEDLLHEAGINLY